MIQHVQYVNVKQCGISACSGTEHGCSNGTECREPRWQRWTHERFTQIFERCPPGCRHVKDPVTPPPGLDRSLADESLHLCHARGCGVPIPPHLLMCLRHWRMVPIDIQRRVWKHYRKGQEIDKRPSPEYLEVMKEAIGAVAKREGL